MLLVGAGGGGGGGGGGCKGGIKMLTRANTISHFTVMLLLGDLVLIQTSLFLSCTVNHVVVMLTTCSSHLHKKSKGVCIKTRSPATALSAISQVTQPQL